MDVPAWLRSAEIHQEMISDLRRGQMNEGNRHCPGGFEQNRHGRNEPDQRSVELIFAVTSIGRFVEAAIRHRRLLKNTFKVLRNREGLPIDS